MAKVLYWLAAIGAVLWAIWYWFVQGLACGWVSSGTPCSMKMPWDLGAEDFRFLVLYPGLPVVILLALAVMAGRSKTFR